MRFAVLLLAAALAGCSLPKNANDTTGSDGSKGSTSATAAPTTTPTPSSPPTASTIPPPPSSPTPKPNATDQPKEATRKIEKQFDLDFAIVGGSLAPPQNCVMMESENTRVYNGTATAKSRGGSTGTGPLELRFQSKGANASAEGQFPLTLEIPSAAVAKDADAFGVLQAASAGVMEIRAQLALTLEVSGGEPAFSVGGCQVAG